MAKSEKLDLYKEHKAEYAASKSKPALVDTGPALYLTIEGQGEPGNEVFQTAVGAMYGVAFTIKMTRKFAGKGDYKVCHLEGLWWHKTRRSGFMGAPRREWRWKLMIRVPDFIGADDLAEARQALAANGKGPEINQVKLERIEEGPCVQMLHVGPFAEEPRTIKAMRELAAAEGLTFRGRHHGIYLSDLRRVPPERLRILLRHPVRPRRR